MSRLLAAIRSRLDRAHLERGSISMFAVVTILGLFAAIGLVVDGGRKIRAVERAQSVAEHAARIAANQIDIPALYSEGGEPRIDPSAAVTAGQAALGAEGATGTVVVSGDGLSVTVTASVTEPTVFLAMLPVGISSVTGEGEATVSPSTGNP